MAFTAKDVAKLREMTGAGMMDCKKALTHTDGDMDKASEYLREIGINIAAKKASRVASEGVVASNVCACGSKGALVEVNCESDFVAKSDDFIELCAKVAKQVTETDPKDLDALLNSKFIDDSSITITELVNAATAKIGEKISVRRFVRQEVACGKEEAYIHMGGKIGVLLEVETDKDLNKDEAFLNMCHDIAMHIAAFGPKYVTDSEVPAEEVAHEKEILTSQLMADEVNKKKPAQVIEKIVEGRINKFFKEICLVYQDFAKDSTITVAKLVSDMAAKFNAKISLKKFSRFVMGEGLEKKVDNLAEEVAKMQSSN